ncbi:MAG TPA: SpvB/TcaC N-terminal domain-containing protein, partial [Blastocatellia bacterium]|nr:SpvB/TcaC N-terminal domain-containing protein [Blastocatellia bacterium]
ESRVFDPADSDPLHPTRIFSWLICQSYDDKGNAIVYQYQGEDSHRIFENQNGEFAALAHERNRSEGSRSVNRYLRYIRYGNRQPNRELVTWQATDPTQLPDNTWMFEVVFDYGEGHYAEDAPDAQGQVFVQGRIDPPPGSHWPVRQDPISTYRAGFEVRTYRLCRRVLMFHHFPQELGINDCLVRSTEFSYAESPIASFITNVSQSGYVRQPTQNQPNRYLKKSLPPLEFEYSQVLTSEQLAQLPIRDVDSESLENLPIGLDGAGYQWMDLDGEGTFGILTEQADGWYYKRNLSANNLVFEYGDQHTVAHLGPTEVVVRKPAIGLAGGGQFLDLASDGQVDLVQMEGSLRGFYERTDDANWSPFQPFASWPDLNTHDPDLKFVDLTGDGHADILVTEGEVMTWYPSLAEEGFGAALRVNLQLDEEKGPRLVFADGTESIYLADLSGDGLSDLVRIRNGEVCYWPNLGYGRFGAKVTMDNAPWFDSPDQFNQQRIRLADTDGSGTTDILYLRQDAVQIYFNQSGNRWSDPVALPQFPPSDNISSVQALDLLGNGTACLVWSSPLPGAVRRPMRYLALMEEKPHLLVGVKNNLGAQTKVHYAPSTKFFLNDKRAGKPWLTRLPFPVHVVELVETYDWISRNYFVTRYAYHHGYFDGVEREFRGFGMVEQWDTEEFAALSSSGDFPTGANVDPTSHVPPVLTKTWFHTGVYVGRDHVSDFFAGLLDADDKGEYYREPGLTDDEARELLLDDTVLPDGLTVEEEREACRGLKGSMLRQEIYALDGTDKAEHPYIVAEQNFTIERLQPRGDNRHAVFFTHANEAITYHYERNPADPRIQHAVTLEVDEFGNVLRSAAMGYGRRKMIRVIDDQGEPKEVPNPALKKLDPIDQEKQTRTLITYTENRVTNPIDAADDYRTPLSAETCTYELTGYVSTASTDRFQASDFVKPDPNDADHMIHWFDNEMPYEQPPTTGKQRRLIEQVRRLYRKDDLSGLLKQERLESRAIPGESYKLAFTSGLLAQVFKRNNQALLPKPADVLGGQGADRGGYVDVDGNGHWWIPSGRVFLSPNNDDTAGQELAHARQHFFLPHRYQDPFGNQTVVSYDSHDLLSVETKDALGNVVTVNTADDAGKLEIRNDYRVLQPYWITDPNRNRTQVVFDARGMLVATVVMGKPGENKGDNLISFESEVTQSEIDALHNANDPHVLAESLLKSASTRIVYDPDRFRLSQKEHPEDASQWEPPYAATLSRETHAIDPLPPQGLKIQISFSYSDGFGREIQKKIQAEPGAVIEGGPVVNPRWVGSGWTIFNNKGKPVRQYEPFFSATHGFDFAKIVGVSPVLFYDPVERVVATLHPNHTWEKAVFDPWHQKAYDVNDTVKFDPRADADISSYVSKYFKQLAPNPGDWNTWVQQRIDPDNPPADTPQLDPEKKAAVLTLPHADTPTAAHLDTLGRTFLTIADNGISGKYATRTTLDIEGNQREVIDAKDRAVMRYDYDMLGNRIHQASMEAGQRWILNDVLGKPLCAWDSRNHQFRTNYDALRRPTDSFLSVGDGVKVLLGRSIYGEIQVNPEAKNLRGKVVQLFDQVGVVSSDEYDFKGNLIRSRRRLASEYKITLDWSGSVPLQDETYLSRTKYDALNRPTQLIAPHSDQTGAKVNVIQPIYNEANLLEQIHAWLGQSAEPAGLLDSTTANVNAVTNIDYNAKGQRTVITYGDGVITNYTYDSLTFRLVNLKTMQGAKPLQDLSYTYDPAGNITHIQDDAQQTIYFNNAVIEPHTNFAYDAIYRLIEATGREHIGQVSQPQTTWSDEFRINFPHPSDGQAMRRYWERYEYDEVGNFLQLVHQANNGNWTRSYNYQEASLVQPANINNRLSGTTVGAMNESYTYDAHGSMLKMPHLPVMQWDFHDQLQQVDLGGGGTAYYVYDAAGQRVRKIHEHNGSTVEERIYLGGFEIYQKRNSTGLQLERETMHVMDGEKRIALIETRTLGNEGSPAQLVRYQFANHLGSSALELDEQGQIISYEEYYSYGSTSYQAGRSSVEVNLKRYRYTGKERDEETGLAYHGARYYAAWLGRWTSTDRAGIADGVNLYEYASAEPISTYDLSGHQSEKLNDLSEQMTGLKRQISDMEAVNRSSLPDNERDKLEDAISNAKAALNDMARYAAHGVLQQLANKESGKRYAVEPYEGPSIGTDPHPEDTTRDIQAKRREEAAAKGWVTEVHEGRKNQTRWEYSSKDNVESARKAVELGNLALLLIPGVAAESSFLRSAESEASLSATEAARVEAALSSESLPASANALESEGFILMRRGGGKVGSSGVRKYDQPTKAGADRMHGYGPGVGGKDPSTIYGSVRMNRSYMSRWEEEARKAYEQGYGGEWQYEFWGRPGEGPTRLVTRWRPSNVKEGWSLDVWCDPMVSPARTGAQLDQDVLWFLKGK